MRNNIRRWVNSTCLLVIASCGNLAMAEEIDIYIGGGTRDDSNILFILDTSGSMNASDIDINTVDANGNPIVLRGQPRISALQAIMSDLLDRTFYRMVLDSNGVLQQELDQNGDPVELAVNLGIFRFKGGTGARSRDIGGSVFFPIVPLNGTTDSIAGELPGGRNRDVMRARIMQLSAAGGTPIPKVLYEAMRYWQGAPVVYARERGMIGGEAGELSHPGSYCTVDRTGRPICPGVRTGNNTDQYGVNLNGLSIEGRPRYVSPIQAECQENIQVLLSDGGATHGDLTQIITASSSTESCRTGNIDGIDIGLSYDNGNQGGSHNVCAYEIVRDLASNDQVGNILGEQTVTTYTVGLLLQDPNNPAQGASAANYLRLLANTGGGQYYAAADYDELEEALSTIIAQSPGPEVVSAATPSLSVDGLDPFSNRDEVYVGLFRPAGTRSWDGNVKKYRICTDVTSAHCTFSSLIDANGDAVVGGDGNIVPTSRNLWSSSPDGDEVTEGGSGERINDYKQTTVYLEGERSDGSLYLAGGQYDDLSDAKFNRARSVACGGHPPISLSECEGYMQWLFGREVHADITRSWTVGDIIHSSPVSITYGNSGGGVYYDRVIVGSNDGALRFIDADTGKQEWMFYPEEMLSKVRYHITDGSGVGAHLYGLDSTPVVSIIDHNHDGTIEASDAVRVFFGMRRGGYGVYALDISPDSLPDPVNDKDFDVSPEFLWRIQADVSGYERLAQTWSEPQVVQTAVAERQVLVFGGGYDPRRDAEAAADSQQRINSGDQDLGNALYFVDAENGELLFFVRGTTTSTCPRRQCIEVPEMKYAIPSQVTVFDADGDGLEDRLYVGDLGGQVWRVDFKTTTNISGTGTGARTVVGVTDVVVGRLADLGDERMFFEPPEIAQVMDTSSSSTSVYDYVTLGSGDRTNPLTPQTKDYFYALRDTTVGVLPDGNRDQLADSGYKTIKQSYLIKVEATDLDIDAVSSPPNNPAGWYYELGGDGEKVLSSPAIAAGKVFFTSFLPDPAGSCEGSIGSGRKYGFDLFSAAAVIDWDGDGTPDRHSDLGSGIPGDVIIFFPPDNPGQIGITAGLTDPSPAALQVALQGRTYWREDR